jgi:hypothetical protein
MSQPSRPDHDALHHRLFGDPRVVAQLLRGFVGGPGGAGIDLSDLDLDRMKRLNAKFHADTGERREGDMIWRIPRHDGADTFLLLLLEFQSTSERFMALRVMAYAALLWQHLARAREIAPDGMLPPVLPVVIYNGDTRWLAPVALRDLFGLPDGSPLWRWQPELRYYLIDAGAFSQSDLAARDGLPALWFRLGSASDPGQVVAVADAIVAWLARHPGFLEARAVFAELLGAMMARTGVGPGITEEFLDMSGGLLERAAQWQQEWLREGLEKGLEKGREEGLREGVQRGEAALLLRLLQRRFGALPGWAVDRVSAAETALLEEWSMRILDAASLEDVLVERPA